MKRKTCRQCLFKSQESFQRMEALQWNVESNRPQKSLQNGIKGRLLSEKLLDAEVLLSLNPKRNIP